MRICKVHRLNQVGTTHNNRSSGQAVASCTLQDCPRLRVPGPGPARQLSLRRRRTALLPSGPAALAVAPADGAAALKPLPSGPGTRRRRAAPGPTNV